MTSLPFKRNVQNILFWVNMLKSLCNCNKHATVLIYIHILQGKRQMAHHLELHLKTHWAFLETSCPGHEGASHASHPLEGSWSFHSHDGTTDHSSHRSLHRVEEFIDVLSAKSINLLCKMSMVSQDCFETQMPPIMANSKIGHDHKDIYFDTSRKILSQEMTMCNMEALIFIF